MSTERPASQVGEPTSAPQVPSIIDQEDLGRPYLEQAFKRVLIALLLTQAVLALYYTDMLEFILDRSFRLCELEAGDSVYCYSFLSFLPPLNPFTSIFSISVLFTLDHYLSISPIFNRLKAYADSTSSGVTTTADGEGSPPTPSSPPPLLRDDEGSARRAFVILRILTISAYAIGTILVAASLTALVDAILTIRHWDEMPEEADVLFKIRVYLVFVEVLYDVLLASILFKTARSLSRAEYANQRGTVQTLPTTAGDRGQAPPSSRPSSTGDTGTTIERFSLKALALWDRRSTLDRIILCLLISLSISTVLSIHYLFFAPWSHSGHTKSHQYFLLYTLNFLLTWSMLFKYQSYRSNEILPDRGLYVFTAVLACILALSSVLDGVSFILLSLYSFLSSPRVLGVLQATALGGPCSLGGQAVEYVFQRTGMRNKEQSVGTTYHNL